jgi:hypothetical protein
MYTVRGTKKFLDRVGPAITDPPEPAGVLGDWYANVLFWRPQVALFVNATTFLPVVMPLAPAASVLTRFPKALTDVLGALEINPRFVASVAAGMGEAVLAKTESRQVLGVMNEFVFMAEQTIGTRRLDPGDLLELSCWLADTIVGPLTKDDLYTPIGALQRHIETTTPRTLTRHADRTRTTLARLPVPPNATGAENRR